MTWQIWILLVVVIIGVAFVLTSRKSPKTRPSTRPRGGGVEYKDTKHGPRKS